MSFIVATNSLTRRDSVVSILARFSVAPPSTSCSSTFASRSRSNSAEVSLRSMPCVSIISVTAAEAVFCERSIAPRAVVSRSRDGARDRSGAFELASLIRPAIWSPFCIIVLAKVTPFASIDCTALWVMRSISVENFCPCAPNVLRNTPVFSSSTRLQIVAALIDVGGELLGLRGEPRATSALTPSSARSTSPAFCFSTVVTPVATVDSARSASVVPFLIAPVTSPDEP